MNEAMRTPRGRWHREMAALGFLPNRGKPGYRAEDLLLGYAAGWGVLWPTRSGATRDPLHADLGEPGLWRWTTTIDSKHPRRIFELPQILLPGGHPNWDQNHQETVFQQTVAWARATRIRDTAALVWTPPPLELVQGWLPEGCLTVRTGTLARQGALVHSARRLALEFPVVSCPDDLPSERRQWLRELLVDARMRWHLARVGFARQKVLAEVDLTGAPPCVLEPLLPVALECLRWLVGWVLESAQFLVDGTAECRALTLQPGRG